MEKFESIIALLASLFLLVVLQQCNVSKGHKEVSIPEKSALSESGVCSAKCMIRRKFEVYEESYLIYTGNEKEEEIDIEIKEIEIRPQSNKWEESMRLGLPVSYALVEEPAVTRTIKILADTTQSRNFKVQKIKREKLINDARLSEWTKILCNDKLTAGIMSQIQQSLKKEGFYIGSFTNEMDEKTKIALREYQKKNGLLEGQLDFTTLEQLGIDLEE